MRNLTKRDKILLSAAAVAAAAVIIIRLVIIPMADRLSELRGELSRVLDERQTMQLAAAEEESARARLADESRKFDELKSRFYPSMSADETDALITGGLLSFNLTPQKADIGEARTRTITPYFASPLGSDSPNGGGDGIMSEYILVSDVIYTAEGYSADFYRFLDYTASNPSVRVTGFDIKYPQDGGSEGISTIKIAMRIYMCKQDSPVG